MPSDATPSAPAKAKKSKRWGREWKPSGRPIARGRTTLHLRVLDPLMVQAIRLRGAYEKINLEALNLKALKVYLTMEDDEVEERLAQFRYPDRPHFSTRPPKRKEADAPAPTGKVPA